MLPFMSVVPVKLCMLHLNNWNRDELSFSTRCNRYALKGSSYAAWTVIDFMPAEPATPASRPCLIDSESPLKGWGFGNELWRDDLEWLGSVLCFHSLSAPTPRSGVAVPVFSRCRLLSVLLSVLPMAT